MKKILITCILAFVIALTASCTNKDNEKGNENAADNITPTTAPTQTPTQTPAPTDAAPTQAPAAEEKTLEDYFPFIDDAQYIYEGIGNEFAAYTVTTDFYDKEQNRIQMREDNGGTVVVSVFEVKDGKVTRIKSVPECYYRDNFLDTRTTEADKEIILMEPMKKGTQWTLENGNKRYISDIEVKVDTPSGTYTAIEVTTEYEDGTAKDYYAPDMGLVKSVYQTGNVEVISTLKEIKEAAPLEISASIYYPNSDEKIYREQKTLSFHTNDKTEEILQQVLREEPQKKGSLPLISKNTKLNSLYLGEDNIVHVDFTKELVQDMNAGAGFEQLILQSITNTLGSLYGVDEVLITMDGKAYESGHILLKEGETLKVDLKAVAE